MVKSSVDAAVLEEAQLVDESAEAGDRVSPSSSVPLNLSVELLRDTVILFSPHTVPFPPAIPIVRFVSESCLYRVCDASCFWELYCPRLSNDLFSVTVGKSALG